MGYGEGDYLPEEKKKIGGGCERWWCMIKGKQSCHHFWKVGENNFFLFPSFSSPLLHSFPSITVCRMYKRNLKATEVVRDLAFPPGPAGVAFKINSIFKREKRCEEMVRDDVRKEWSRQQKKERNTERKNRWKKREEGGCNRGQRRQSRERECISFHVL